MVQLQTIVVKGDKVNKNGGPYYTIQDEIVKKVNPILADLGDAVKAVEPKFIDDSTAVIVLVVEVASKPAKSGK